MLKAGYDGVETEVTLAMLVSNKGYDSRSESGSGLDSDCNCRDNDKQKIAGNRQYVVDST